MTLQEIQAAYEKACMELGHFTTVHRKAEAKLQELQAQIDKLDRLAGEAQAAAQKETKSQAAAEVIEEQAPVLEKLVN